MTSKRKRKNLLRVLCLIAVTAVMLTAATIFTKADTIVVEEYYGTDAGFTLDFAKIQGKSDTGEDLWESKGTLEQGGGKYTLKTNSFAAWFSEDSVDFGYKPVKFNYGKEGVLTIEVNLQSWNGKSNTASAGIMLRSSLENNAACLFLHWRPQGGMVLYRMKQGVAFSRDSKIYSIASTPVGFKAVLTGSKVTCYYRTKLDGPWVQTNASVPFQFTGDTVYAGIAAHSSDESDLATAVFDGLHIKTEVPEDYDFPEDPDDPDKPEGPDKPEEPELPEDLPLTEDILLKETFTDKDLFNLPTAPNNPLWHRYGEDSDIRTTPDYTNRYLSLYYTEDQYYTAGDQQWTDYSVSMDVTFPEDSSENESNTFKLLLRHQNIASYGYNDYAVIFTTAGTEGARYGKIQLGTRYLARNSIVNTSHTVLQEISLNDEAYSNIFSRTLPSGEEQTNVYFDGRTHKLRADCFDNVITVYIDGIKIFEYTDTDSVKMHAVGSIGFGVNKGNVYIDNVTVRKLNDPVGGDLDNKIKGNWDLPIPDYIQDYWNNKWTY